MIEREALELDILFVGAGPASLAGAIHLKRLLQESGQNANIGILEKAVEVGAVSYTHLRAHET